MSDQPIQQSGSMDQALNVTGTGVLRALDLRDPADMAMAHELMRRAPRRIRALSDEVLDEMVAGLREGMRLARQKIKSNDPHEQNVGMTSSNAAARVAAQMVQINQRDEHAILDRIAPKPRPDDGQRDQGPPIINVQIVQVAPGSAQ